jgi:hypothetical protein
MRVAPYAIALTLVLQLGSPATLAAQDDTYVAPSDELTYANIIIEAMYPADKREQMVLNLASTVANQMATGQMTGPIFEEPGIKAIMDQFLRDFPETLRPTFSTHLPAIFEATAIAYTREYTLEELRDISAFARTPSGQRYFLSLEKLQSDPAVSRANTNMFRDIGPLAKEQGSKVRQQVEAYLLANPEILERLQKATEGKTN